MWNYSISRHRSDLGVQMVALGRAKSTDDNDNNGIGQW